jgi:hypothetical protein
MPGHPAGIDRRFIRVPFSGRQVGVRHVPHGGQVAKLEWVNGVLISRL